MKKENDINYIFEHIPKKSKYTIRMDVTSDEDIDLEEAEKRIYGALRSVGVKAHSGGMA